MANVIKRSASARQPQPAVFRYDDVAAETGNAEARAQADAIVTEALAQADEIRHAAEASAQQVRELLEVQIAERMDAVMPLVRQATAELVACKQSWLARWEQSAVQLAVKIAERVTRQEIARSPQLALNLVREALEMATGAPQIKLRLNPADFAAMEAQVKQLAYEISRAADTSIVPDESIARGGCRLETQHGAIDQQIETRLNRIAAELCEGSD